jgi:hypothetical protein
LSGSDRLASRAAAMARRRRRGRVDPPGDGQIISSEPPSPVDQRVSLPADERPHAETVLPNGTRLVEWRDPPLSGGGAAPEKALPPLLADDPWQPADDPPKRKPTLREEFEQWRLFADRARP